MGYEIFEDLCKRKGVKTSEVARSTGVSTSTISAWKQGLYTPKKEKLQKLADYFGVTLEYLTTGENADGYYYDAETAKLAQEIYQNPELHMLLDAARDSSASDIKAFYDMVLLMKRRERHEED